MFKDPNLADEMISLAVAFISDIPDWLREFMWGSYYLMQKAYEEQNKKEFIRSFELIWKEWKYRQEV